MPKDFNSIKQYVISLLEEQLPAYLHYHNIPHTLYVINIAEHIGEKERITKTEMNLLKIAALYHDVGFINKREGHEEESCKIARLQLQEFGYSKKAIEIICETIMATKIPQNPTNHLGEILADADLEYLATKRFEPVSQLLFKELKHFNPKLTNNEWNAIQIKFISNHNYHTRYCKHYKSFRKLNNLRTLVEQT